MKVMQLLESAPSQSDLGKKIRAIAAAHGLTAANHQYASYMIQVAKKHTRAKFMLKLRDAKALDRQAQEKEIVKRVKGFVHDLSTYLKETGLEVEFVGRPTNGKLMNNWEGGRGEASTTPLSRGEKAVFNQVEFARMGPGTGSTKERIEASYPEAWMEFKIVH